MRIDAEIDFHGYTAAQMRDWLERTWASRRWHGLRRVHVIHGKGAVLGAALRAWCDEKGIPWAPEAGNPGSTFLHPARRAVVPPGRANRPLSRHMAMREASRAIEVPPVPSPPPSTPSSESGSEDPLAVEFERLGEAPALSLLRKKHSGG